MTHLSRLLMTTAVKADALYSRVFGRNRIARRIIPYDGYATPDHLIALGRVQAAVSEPVPSPYQSRLRNFRDILSLFLTSEVAHADLIVDGKAVETDGEGYFTLAIPREGRSGTIPIAACLPGRDARMCKVFAPEPKGPALVICDIDDTVLHTGAFSLLRNLWNSLTGNVLTREVYQDATDLLQALDRAGHPVHFVSSSPWNLYDFLRAIFERAGVPRGPMFLRDLGLSETKFIVGSHSDHKGTAIDTVLAANPHRQAILIGDTGQKDARIYHDATQRHPGRIDTVILRVPAIGLDRTNRADIAKLEASGVRFYHGADFSDFLSNSEFPLSTGD